MIPVDASRQREAMRLLATVAFSDAATSKISPALLNRLIASRELPPNGLGPLFDHPGPTDLPIHDVISSAPIPVAPFHPST